MPGLVALTGATGFIGRHLVPDLLGKGWQVRALTRRAPPPEISEIEGLEWLSGDLDDLGALESLVAGAHSVVHCAGLVKARSKGKFYSVNAQSVKRLAGICASAADKPRFILISSLAARAPHVSHYAGSKFAGEEELRAFSAVLDWTILRPSAVYGPGDTETLAIFKAVSGPFVPLPAGGGGRVSLIHVSDVVSAIGTTLSASETVGGVFELDDGTEEGYVFRTMMETIGRHLQLAPRFVSIPSSVLSVIGTINQTSALIAGYTPRLTAGKARELCHPDWVCSDRSLARITAWRPRILAEEGLRQTLDWYRNRGLL